MANKRKNENKKSTETEPIQEETLQTVLVQVDASNTETASDVPQVSGEHADVTEEAGTQELFSTQMETEPGVGDWAESGASCDPLQFPTPPDMFSEGDETPVPIPEELVYLRNTGAHFSHVPSTCWKLNQSSARLYKNRSVYFSVDTVCTSHDILFGFDKAGIDIDTITSIQRRNSNRSWVVSFGTFEEKECALEVGGVTVCGLEVFLGDAQFLTVLVKIYECHNEMPDTAVIGRLSKYGRVLSFRCDKIGDVLYNGVRTARMRLMNHIPCSIHVVGEPIIVYYESQPRTCRHSGDTDHVAQNCHTPRCYNCDALDIDVSTVWRSFFVQPVSLQIMKLLCVPFPLSSTVVMMSRLLPIAMLPKHMQQLLSLPLLWPVHLVKIRGKPSRRVDKLQVLRGPIL